MLKFKYTLPCGIELEGSINYDPVYEKLHVPLCGDDVKIVYHREQLDNDINIYAVIEDEEGRTVLGGEESVRSFLDPFPGTLLEEYSDAVWAAFEYLDDHWGAE